MTCHLYDVSLSIVVQGTHQHIIPPPGSIEQQWYRGDNGALLSAINDKCLDVEGGPTGYNLIVWDCHGQDNQIFTPDSGMGVSLPATLPLFLTCVPMLPHVMAIWSNVVAWCTGTNPRQRVQHPAVWTILLPPSHLQGASPPQWVSASTSRAASRAPTSLSMGAMAHGTSNGPPSAR